MDTSKPQSFIDLPLELLIEVARYLQPLDLMQASRASKSFRSLFMRRSAALVWETTFRNVEGLPPCPEGVCEPRYAALLFIEECSICAQPAPRDMDPGVLVRLCSECLEKERMDIVNVKHRDLVFASYVYPDTTMFLDGWCLYRDVKDVETTYEALIAAGDEEATTRWVNKRRQLVTDWNRKAKLLQVWIRNRFTARFFEHLRLKEARQAQIKSRLIALGWRRADFRQSKNWPQAEWDSLVYNPEPLDDHTWERILPSILEHIKKNRDQRLQNEAFRRKKVRMGEIKKWLEAVQNKLSPLVLATRKPNNTEEVPMEQSCEPLLNQLFPMIEVVETWPEYMTLVETDLPTKSFRVEFRRKRGQLTRLIADWRRDAEAAALEILPKDTLPVSSHSIQFNLATIAGDDTRPFDYLPVDTRRLLRADATFSNTNNWAFGFYPDIFCSWTETTKLEYDYDASKIAKALLRVLGCPEASYPEMKTFNDKFVCGRCDKLLYTWPLIVQHFYDEGLKWQRYSQILSARVEVNKSFAYLFTHDVDAINPQPLVRIVEAPTPPGPCFLLEWCKICDEIESDDIQFSGTHEQILNHLRDVHLIENPADGLHYTLSITHRLSLINA
ncbi:Protein SFI1 [Ceratobasidium theobromae]|uniref:Protein SFI1 n=1 Tax=Ceratobasidium theobromae TaxID=1582974 RepID=A0A5N5QB63_9AGAM|nr:Protein SFI1 [Ceratobasidium theobromae]